MNFILIFFKFSIQLWLTSQHMSLNDNLSDSIVVFQTRSLESLIFLLTNCRHRVQKLHVWVNKSSVLLRWRRDFILPRDVFILFFIRSFNDDFVICLYSPSWRHNRDDEINIMTQNHNFFIWDNFLLQLKVPFFHSSRSHWQDIVERFRFNPTA